LNGGKDKMADIKKILGKPIKINLSEDVEIELKPLTVSNLDIILDLQQESTKKQAMKELLEIYIKQAFPDATKEELESVPINILVKIMEKVIEVNGL